MITATYTALTDSALFDATAQAFGRMHPMLVHFPIGLLLVAALLELVQAVRGSEARRRAILICLELGALGAVAAAFSGWVYVDREGSNKALVELHRWFGVAVASLAVLTAILARIALRRDDGPVVVSYRLGLILTAVATAVTGHLGGEMSWGKNWLLEPFQRMNKPSEPSTARFGEGQGGLVLTPSAGSGANAQDELDRLNEPQPTVAAAIVFARDIRPILEARCFECHGPTGKAEAELRLHDVLVANEEFYSPLYDALLVPGDPEASALFAVVSLPRDDEDCMPPEGEGDPLSAQELELLRRWIADATRVEDLVARAGNAPLAPLVNETAQVVEVVHSASPASAPEHSGRRRSGTDPFPDLPAFAEQALEPLRARGVRVERVALDTGGVEAVFRYRAETSDLDLEPLRALAPNLVALDLARTAVGDLGYALVGELGQLRRLHAEGTAISDVGVAEVAKLERLEYLNLTETKITDACIETLAELPQGCRVFLWGSGVTEAGKLALAARRPDLVLP